MELRESGLTACHTHHMGAVISKRDGRGASETTAGAGDNGGGTDEI
jgi:hypothetical protein